MGTAKELDQADYVIAGGGSAGCVLACRLSEDPQKRVVLLEVGGSTNRFWVNVPAGLNKNIADPALNWFHATEPDPSLGDRRVLWHSGKGLGGGSAINGMVYIRGSRSDYDAWAAAGCAGWGWEDVLPCFRRAESFEGGASASHGNSGPLGVSPLRVVHPLARPFLAACEEIGIPGIEDYCAGNIDGAFINYATQRHGLRSSTASSYLHLAKKRRNLQVITGALVDRVLIENGRAVGVEFLHDGVSRSLRVRREVIVSAGAIQSPAILLRSGIGPAEELQALGIQVQVDSPNVGRNLHEHPSLHSARLVDTPTYNSMKNPFRLGFEGLKYIFTRRGLLTTPAVHAMAHARSRPDMAEPDLKLQFLPFANDPVRKTPHAQNGVTVSINIMRPKARGQIRLRSLDPAEKPVIDYRMFEHPEDLAAMRAGVRLVDRIYAASPLDAHVLGRIFPLQPELSDETLDELIRENASVGYHPVSSCRMGADSESVVDPELRVRGVSGLRVSDASVMPVMPSANTNAPTIMIGEKAADLISNAVD